MSSTGATDYAVRVIMEDGTTVPSETEEMDWVSLEIAKKIAAKTWEARVSVVNSPVVALEIIDADYKTVQITRF